MSVSVPLIGDPRDQLLEALPFVHAHARDQCHRAIRRVFDATAEQENVQIMLNLSTLSGDTLLAMMANIVRYECELLVVLTGREVDSGLAGLLHNEEGSATKTNTAVSESSDAANANDEELFRSVSEEGSVKGYDVVVVLSSGIPGSAIESCDGFDQSLWTRSFRSAAEHINTDGDAVDYQAIAPEVCETLASDSLRDDASASVVSSLTGPELGTLSKAYSGSTMSTLTMSSFTSP